MFSYDHNSGDCSTTTARPTRLRFRTGPLLAFALALAACSGGSGSGAAGVAQSAAPNPQTPTAGPPAATPTVPKDKGSVIVRAMTTAGAPISGVSVALNGGFDGRSKTTDGNGEALFRDVPTGDASTNLGGSGYHWAGLRLVVTKDLVTKVAVTLEHVTEATPVVLATHPVASSDGKTLSVDVDIAVLDGNGVARETLTAADFRLNGACDWGWCVVDTDGTDTNRGYDAHVVDATFSPLPTPVLRTMAAGILLDQSADMATFDPSGIRLQAVNNFLESVTPPNTVALGSFQRNAATPTLTTYGGFTSDAPSLRTAVSALAGNERGTNPLHAALAEMIAFTAANAPAGSSKLRRSVIVVTNSWPIDECPDARVCQRAKQAIAGAAQASDISVIAIGTDGPAAEIAARTKGAFAYVQDPAQLPVVFHALGSIVSRNVAYNRVRLELDAGQPGTFLPGRTVGGYLEVAIGPNTHLMWWLAFPI
jgi:hypothetical protein